MMSASPAARVEAAARDTPQHAPQTCCAQCRPSHISTCIQLLAARPHAAAQVGPMHDQRHDTSKAAALPHQSPSRAVQRSAPAAPCGSVQSWAAGARPSPSTAAPGCCTAQEHRTGTLAGSASCTPCRHAAMCVPAVQCVQPRVRYSCVQDSGAVRCVFVHVMVLLLVHAGVLPCCPPVDDRVPAQPTVGTLACVELPHHDACSQEQQQQQRGAHSVAV